MNAAQLLFTLLKKHFSYELCLAMYNNKLQAQAIGDIVMESRAYNSNQSE